MTTSENGIANLKIEEGFCGTIKADNKGPMIGYGHDLQSGESFPNGITLAAADLLLRKDLATRFEPAVNRLAPWANQNEFDALVSFCYNLGPRDMAIMLAHGQAQVPQQMPHWCYEEVDGIEQRSEALEERRMREVALYAAPEYV